MSSLKRVLIVAVSVLAVLTVFFFRKGYENNLSYLSGDEPHYIMMTDSLVKDGDFNLKNDYELNRAIKYYPVPGLFPHISALTDKNSSNWYSIHTIGLPLIMYLPYRLFGVVGARIWLIVLQFSAVFIFYLIVKKYAKSDRAKWIGLALLLTCPVFWQNLGAVFPDLLIVTIWGAIILLFDNESWFSDLAIICLAILGGLVHTKAIVLIAPLVLFRLLWLIKKNGISKWVLNYKLSIAVLLLGAAAYVRFLHQRYGVFSPSQLYGSHGQLFAANPLDNMVAMLTDRSKGILVYFPVLVICGPYLYRAFSESLTIIKKLRHGIGQLNRNYFLIAGLGLGLTGLLITQLGFLDWSGSTAPNGRYLLPFVFVTIFIIASYAKFDSWIERIFLGSAAITGLILSTMSILDFRYYMSTGVNSFWVTRIHPLVHLPLFNMTASDHDHDAMIRGLEVLFLVAVMNVALVNIYNLKIIVKKRS